MSGIEITQGRGEDGRSGDHEEDREVAHTLRVKAKYKESIELWPRSEEEVRALLHGLSPLCEQMPELPAGMHLERVTLSFGRRCTFVTVESPPTPRLLGVWEEGRRFKATYKSVSLQEYGLDRNSRPRDVVGRVKLKHKELLNPVCISLTPQRFLPLLALVVKNAAVDSECLSSRGRDAVTFGGTELCDSLVKLVEERGLPRDSASVTEREISDYFRLINLAVEEYRLPRLVLGTAKRGFRLDVHPGDIRFIPSC